MDYNVVIGEENMNKEIERIKALSDAFGPSGFEDEVADLVESRKISMIFGSVMNQTNHLHG